MTAPERPNDRPQDVGRAHRRGAGGLDPESAALLMRYRSALRRELEDLLDEIRPKSGQVTLDGSVERPSLEARRALWDLAVKLARELAGGTDAGLEAVGNGAPTSSAKSARRLAPRLSARERRALGGE